MKLSEGLESFTHHFARWAGSARGFIAALITMIVWFSAGKLCGFSGNWVNCFAVYIGTITFLMLFLIQRSQNKEFTILHVKLNELLAATKHADNRMINVEELTEKEIFEVQEIHREIGAKD